jgi:hypothetical protein
MGRTACTEPYSRAIPLLPLLAVRPVQSLSACTVQLYLYSPYWPYGLYKASVPVQGCTLTFLLITIVCYNIDTYCVSFANYLNIIGSICYDTSLVIKGSCVRFVTFSSIQQSIMYCKGNRKWKTTVTWKKAAM